MIFDKITPYVGKLKGFEKKTVAVNELLPPFERSKHGNVFDISDTGFQLVLDEVSGIVKVVVAGIDRGFGKLQDICSVARFEYGPT